MSKTFALVGTLVAVSLAFVTKDLESPSQRRVRKGGRDLRMNPAFVVPSGAPAAEGPSTDAPDEPAKKQPAKPDVPEAPEILFEPRVVDNEDLDLCIAPNADIPTVESRRLIELEILMEGEVFWYHKTDSKEQETDKMLSKRLALRSGRHLALVPHEFSNWLRFREICEVARVRGFGERLWIGAAASEDEPRTLLYLPFPLDGDGTADVKEDGDYFVIGVREKGDEGVYTVNGKPVDPDSLGADIAVAWIDWKKQYPAVAKEIVDPDTTPVVLDIHRYTPMKYVVKVIDRLRGMDIPCERLAGDKIKRRR